MSNVHEIHVVAEVPYDWTSSLKPDEAQFIVGWLMSPCIGLKYSYSSSTSRLNEHGGVTQYYRLKVTGREAMSGKAQDVLITILKKYSWLGCVVGEARDIENSSGWWDMVKAAEQHAVV